MTAPDDCAGIRTRSLCGLLLVLAAFVAVNARWLWLVRRGQPLDMDEAGYLGFALIDHAGLLHGGLRGFLAAVAAPGIQAPLAPALAALVFRVTGPHLIVGFAVPLLAGAAGVAGTYGLGSALGSRRVGLAGAVLVASCPIIIVYARSFLFALPAACMATLALLALLRSDRFRDPGWAAAFGLCCGLLPLARTMTVAFIPGLVLGAAVSLVGDRADLGRRALALTWALLLGLATAATWYWSHGHWVFDYLFKFGYGSQAAEYGRALPLFGLAAWCDTLRDLVACVYLPHALVLLAGAAAVLWLAMWRIARGGGWRALAASQAAPLAIYVAAATAALASSQNKGPGFFAPIVPAAIVLAVWGCDRAGAGPRWHRALGSVTALVALLGAVPALDPRLPLARPWRIAIPVLGPTTITDGRGYIEVYEGFGGFAGGDAMRPISAAAGRQWVAFSDATTAALLRAGAADTTTAFGFIHLLYNLNTVRLDELRGGHAASRLIQVDPLATGDSRAGDLAWLTRGAAAQACLLLTFEGTTGLVFASADGARMADAARQAGFVPAQRWATPDGQPVTLWQRRAGVAGCGEARAP